MTRHMLKVQDNEYVNLNFVESIFYHEATDTTDSSFELNIPAVSNWIIWNGSDAYEALKYWLKNTTVQAPKRDKTTGKFVSLKD